MTSHKLLAGALLAGMGILTGEATLIATAGGIGVNWLADELGGLWPMVTRARGTSDPLTNAYAKAIRTAVQGLEDEYHHSIDPRARLTAFRLIAECAQDIAQAELPVEPLTVENVQGNLQAGLAALLFGHDERQVEFLQKKLLSACASSFRAQLMQDDAAWRAFHGVLLQAMTRNITTLMSKLNQFTDVLTVFGDPETMRTQLQRIEDHLASTAEAATTKTGPVFNNQGMRVGGNVTQINGNQYNYSAHVTGGGSASITNIIGAPAVRTTSASDKINLLFLAANPLNTERLRLDQEARRIDEALRHGRQNEYFHLAQQWAVRSEDLLDALLRYQPAILHFSGHSSADGHLYLENADGEAKPVSPAAMTSILRVANHLRCVVLNACWSDTLAQALLASCACVVGMANSVEDATAIAFAAGFYRALADGKNVATAVEAGRAEALVENPMNAALIVTIRTAAGVDARQMYFSRLFPAPSNSI